MFQLGIIAFLISVGIPILVIYLFFQNRSLKERVSRLEQNARFRPAQAQEVADPPPTVQQTTPPPRPPQVTPAAPTPSPEPTPAKVTTVPQSKKLKQNGLIDFTETLKAANWLILAGGIVLAFGVGFLIKYSIDEGLLGPLARVTIGALLGSGLIVFGEMARHRSFGRVAAVVRQDALPPTLTAAGLLALFTSCYGAYALYDMLPALVAFVLLAVIALSAVGLSLIHGPVIGALGLAAAFAVPVLVGIDIPSPLSLFSYLSVVTLGSLGIARLRPWPWLSWIALAGSAIWMAFMTVASYGDALQRPVIFTFALIMVCAFALMLQSEEDTEKPARSPAMSPSFFGPIVFALLTLLFFASRSPDETSLLAVSAMTLALIVIAYRVQAHFYLLPLAGLFSLACLLVWYFPRAGFYVTPLDLERDMGLVPVAPPNTTWFLILSGANLALFTVLGLLRALKRKPQFGLWAGVSVATALLTLTTAFVRIKGFETSLSWGLIGLVAALAFLFSANALRQKAPDAQNDPALAAYAVGVLGAIALAFTMVLEEAWLSVALAALLPGLGWISLRLDVLMLRRIATLLSGIVLVRLVFNPFVLAYAIEPPLYLNWMIYGFGAPMIAFFFAARMFGRSKRDLTVHVLEAGALVFAIALIVSQFRLYIHDGNLMSPSYLLSEACFNTLIWFGLAYGLARSPLAKTSQVVTVGARVLFTLAAGHLFWVHLFLLNPMVTNEAVGTLFFFNILALAYLAPCLFFGLFLLSPGRTSMQEIIGIKAPWMLSVPPYVLGLIYLSLEVRHAFHGPLLNAGQETDAELYVYSLVWLLYAATLMGLGIWKKNGPLRAAALATIALTTLKIFLMDMGELEGLLRVFSFFGLAISLLGIGYLYQRFVVTAPPVQEDDG